MRILLIFFLISFSLIGLTIQPSIGGPTAATHCSEKALKSRSADNDEEQGNRQSIANQLVSIGKLIECLKAENPYRKFAGIMKQNGYSFRGCYHDPELADHYSEDVYYKNCVVAACGAPIKFKKGISSVLTCGSAGFGHCITLTIFNKNAFEYIKSELKKHSFKLSMIENDTSILSNGEVEVDIIADNNQYCFTFWIPQAF